MSGFEVLEPIQNSPFEEPTRHWLLREGEAPDLREGRRPPLVYAPRDQATAWDLSDGLLIPSPEYAPGFELTLVAKIRERMSDWRGQDFPGATRVTLELLKWWNREGRESRLFFAQREAAETVIFLREARQDFLQGLDVPLDEPSLEQRGQGLKAFVRYACKMATGAGKTTVMGMLAAWSILNKLAARQDARFSDVVLVVCPNVTIRDRLRELDPNAGEASVYRKRDIVPRHLMSELIRGRIIITNWHGFELRSPDANGDAAKVVKRGVAVRTRETIRIGSKTTTSRGRRFLTLDDLERQQAAGLISVLTETRDADGGVKSVEVESVRYVESDAAWDQRVFGQDIGSKGNLLVLNDEAHHAYRIVRNTEEEQGSLLDDLEEEDAEEFVKEATVWIEGLDRVNRLRGLNFCVDLSATPYFLGRVGREANKPFPWVVSDFGLVEAIESGLVKIPQMTVRDNTGSEVPGYFNIWEWIQKKLTSAEKGGKRGDVKPEAVLKYANTPIAMLAGLWRDQHREWRKHSEDPRPPVFILVCKNTRIAKMLYEWIAEDKRPRGIPSLDIREFRNENGKLNTLRVDSKVVHETDSGQPKSDEHRWMRFTLDTVGVRDWPTDELKRPVYPEGFEELARKLGRQLHPPGRDVLCIISVGMLTEGWDCNTVSHIIGLRPFMSQLLCEQVVGRGLRRVSYDLDEAGRFREEIAKIFGVPFDVIPFKATPGGTTRPPEKRHHVKALPEREGLEIRIPRVEGYTQAIRNRVTVDWEAEGVIELNPLDIPPEVEMKAALPNNQGRPSLYGPGRLDSVTLNPYRSSRRQQALVFDLATSLTKEYATQPSCEIPVHVLFPQMLRIVERYLREKVRAVEPAKLVDAFLSPYYGWIIERLIAAIRPDTSLGEAPEVPCYEKGRGPCSTKDVDFWTSKSVREIRKCHLNYAVFDTRVWEQSAACHIDRHHAVESFVKNQGLGFAIPYLHNGQPHDYIPDFIIRIAGRQNYYLIVETKGYDPLEGVKKTAAERWIKAVNADGTYGEWGYAIARSPDDVIKLLNKQYTC